MNVFKIINLREARGGVVLRVLFLVFVLLFVANNVMPSILDLLNTQTLEIVETGDSKSEKEKEETKKESEADDYLYLLMQKAWAEIGSPNFAAQKRIIWCNLSFDIVTPPPEGA